MWIMKKCMNYISSIVVKTSVASITEGKHIIHGKLKKNRSCGVVWLYIGSDRSITGHLKVVVLLWIMLLLLTSALPACRQY